MAITTVKSTTSKTADQMKANELASTTKQFWDSATASSISKISAVNANATTSTNGLTADVLKMMGDKIAYLNPAIMRTMDSSQIGALDVTKLTDAQFKALSTAQISALTDSQILSLSDKQLAMLTPLQVSGTNATNGLSANDISLLGDKVALLNAKVINSFDVSQTAAIKPSAISLLSDQQIKALYSGQLSALTDDQIKALTDKQISLLSALQVNGSTNTNGFSGADLALLGDKVTLLQTNVLSTMDKTQVAGISESALDKMSAVQIKALINGGAAQLQQGSMTVNTDMTVINGSTGFQAVTIGKDADHVMIGNKIEKVIFSGKSTDYSTQFKDGILTVTNTATGEVTAKIQALKGSEYQFSDATFKVDTDYVNKFTMTKTADVSNGSTLMDVSKLTDAQLKLLTANQIDALTDAQIAQFTEVQLAKLSIYQVNGVNGSSMTPSKGQAVNGFSASDIALLGDKAAAFSTGVIQYMDKNQINAFSESALDKMTPAQIKILLLAHTKNGLDTSVSNTTITEDTSIINGRSGTQTVTLDKDADHVIIGSGIEKVVFSGNYGDYTSSYKEGLITFKDKAGDTVAIIQVQSGSTYEFANDSFKVEFTRDGQVNLTSLTPKEPEPVPEAPTTETPVAQSSEYKFIYNGNFGAYDAQVKAALDMAAADLFQYIDSKGTVEIQINAVNLGSNVLANAGSDLFVKTLANVPGANLTAASVYEMNTGIDINGSAADGVMNINVDFLKYMNFDWTKAPTSQQLDFAALMQHELFHVIGFTGLEGTGSSSAYNTGYDTKVVYSGSQVFFNGANAVKVNGGLVELTGASAGDGSAFYHVKDETDLMSMSTSYGKEEKLSVLDLAMLKDIGVPLVGTLNFDGNIQLNHLI